MRTRARHDLPPQPYEWFQNLIACLGDTLAIRLAYKDATPIAAVLTLRFRDSVFYKYGASDARYKNLGATPLLLWTAIKESKSTGAKEFSLGRTDEDNTGLINFKNHWTHRSTPLVYWRYPGPDCLESRERLESRHGQANFRDYAPTRARRNGKINLPSHRLGQQIFEAHRSTHMPRDP